MKIIISVALGLLVVIVAVTLHGYLRVPSPSKTIPLSGQKFPEGFLWATGEDAYQHEGGNDNNDWYLWEKRDPSPIDNGDRNIRGIDFYNRYEQDFTLAKNDRQNAHRIGIEWSRVEPERGRYDEAAWRHYENMLKSLKDKDFTVFLNLWHFTLPVWAAEQGGWENPALMERWDRYVTECARRFGRYVDYWSTTIDAQIYALNGHAVGAIPPNRRDMDLAITVYRTMIRAHARAYHIIKKEAAVPAGSRHDKPQIGMIYFFFYYEPQGHILDRFVCRQMDDIFNWQMLDALHTGKIDIGVLGTPTIRETDESVRGTLDWIGVNYYTRQIISFNLFKPGFIEYTDLKRYSTTDMGWEIYPEGIYRICKELGRRYEGVPLCITESGLADADDDRRPRYIADHLTWVHRLIQEGCPLFGFTYWSLLDNWEWEKGFWPKFGLYRVDLESLARTPRGSVKLYRFISKQNRLPDEAEYAGMGFEK